MRNGNDQTCILLLNFQHWAAMGKQRKYLTACMSVKVSVAGDSKNGEFH